MIGQESAQHMSSTSRGCWAERVRRQAELKIQMHSLMIARAKGYRFTVVDITFLEPRT